MKTMVAVVAFGVVVGSVFCSANAGAGDGWGAVQNIQFNSAELPENLYSMFTGNTESSVLQYCLPKDYSIIRTYPLVLYVPGFHGHRGGNIENAKAIGDNHECVVASLPLFKADVTRSEVGEGVIVSFADYPVLSSAYRTMLEKLYQVVPNIDPDRSAMVGYSNGAITVAVLLSSHDTYVLNQFHSYCLVDHGMFHLTDLHKSPASDRRYLILVGDKDDYGRELKLRAAKLVEDCNRLLGIEVESRVLRNTGHELTDACKKAIGEWIFE